MLLLLSVRQLQANKYTAFKFFVHVYHVVSIVLMTFSLHLTPFIFILFMCSVKLYAFRRVPIANLQVYLRLDGYMVHIPFDFQT